MILSLYSQKSYWSMLFLIIFSPFCTQKFSLVIERRLYIDDKIIKQHMRESIVSLLRLKKTGNPEAVQHIKENIFSHTNLKGKQHIFYVYTSNRAYKIATTNTPHRLYKINTFYIVAYTQLI